MKAFVFDLDDTLYPERAYVRSGFRAVARWAEERLAIPAGQGFCELCRLFDGGARGNTFDLWLASHAIAPAPWLPGLVSAYRAHEPEITPYPGTVETLSRLRRPYRLGLLSDGPLDVQQRKLAALGIRPLFDALVFSDELGRAAWKPSLKPFQTVLERLGIDGCEAVYVADNPLKDFIGARRAGMRTIRIRYEDGLYAGLEPPSVEHAPDEEVTTLDRLEAILIGGRS